LEKFKPGGGLMAEQVKVSADLIERLVTRIEALEKKLEDQEPKKKKEKEKSTTRKVADSLSDTGNKVVKESGKIMSSIVDATAEAMKEGANAVASISDETNTEELGEFSAAIVSIFRKTLDVQKKAINKFEESYQKYED
jgi:Mg2+ and Co2+ transporter CorA